MVKFTVYPREKGQNTWASEPVYGFLKFRRVKTKGHRRQANEHVALDDLSWQVTARIFDYAFPGSFKPTAKAA
jgi:hypothetical protein